MFGEDGSFVLQNLSNLDCRNKKEAFGGVEARACCQMDSGSAAANSLKMAAKPSKNKKQEMEVEVQREPPHGAILPSSSSTGVAGVIIYDCSRGLSQVHADLIIPDVPKVDALAFRNSVKLHMISSCRGLVETEQW